jgi:EAL domain-containing protein (putative c-di-GMP-specific phosphodiesterase class I)
MLNNSESQEIVKTILSLGSNLGMGVVAEGVETPEQVSLLKSFGRVTSSPSPSTQRG